MDIEPSMPCSEIGRLYDGKLTESTVQKSSRSSIQLVAMTLELGARRTLRTLKTAARQAQAKVPTFSL